MAGIYFIQSKNEKRGIPKNNFNRMYSSGFSHTLNEEIHTNEFCYGRSVVNKFLDDRFLYEDDDCIIAIEGIIYNQSPAKTTIPKLLKQHGLKFIDSLKGQYSGIILNKKENLLHAFTDQLSSKPLYYHVSIDNKLAVVASEGKFISSLLGDLNLHVNLDTDSLKSLFCIGYLFEGSMPITEVKKLLYGSVLTINLTTYKTEITKYFRLSRNIEYNSKEEIIQEIDRLLISSVNEEWEKDQQYNYDHYAFLSGGLDSRVNIMLALELGFNNLTTLTFAHLGSRDQKIAAKIAGDHKLEHNFKELDGSYLFEPASNYVKANDGLTTFLAAAHLYHTTSNLSLKNFGSIHSGQIGDVLFGSFSASKPVSLSTVYKLGFVKEKGQLSKLDFLSKLIENYQYEGGSEIFAYEQRQFNGTLNGDRTSNHFYDMTSPFYNRELIEFCLKIDPKLKQNEAIYLDWFNSKHPQISSYVWQNTGLKPTAHWKTAFGKKYRKYASRLFKELGLQFDSMNPFTEWFSKNPALNNHFINLYQENLDILNDSELKLMAKEIFESNIPSHKIAVVSALLSAKLYLNELP